MFLWKKHKKIIYSNVSLSDNIIQELKLCYVDRIDTSQAPKSSAKKYLSELFGKTNKMYSNVRIKICSLNKRGC